MLNKWNFSYSQKIQNFYSWTKIQVEVLCEKLAMNGNGDCNRECLYKYIFSLYLRIG